MANMQGAPAPDEEPKTALEQYGVDLTAIAGTGKLDPVIGRDAEIRRVSQALVRPPSLRDSRSASLPVTLPTPLKASGSSPLIWQRSLLGQSIAASSKSGSRLC